MAYLLDTHTFLWFLNGSDDLSAKARKAVEDNRQLNYVSIVSFWEIAIKISLGKLELGISYEELQLQTIKNGFEFLPLTFEHSAGLIGLEFHHRDPFDRMIISQAIVEGLTIIGKDQNFPKYPVKLLW